MKNSLIEKFLGMIVSVFKRDDLQKPKRKYKNKMVYKTKREFPEIQNNAKYKVEPEPEDLSTIALFIEIEARKSAVKNRENALINAEKLLNNVNQEDAIIAAKAAVDTAKDLLKIAESRLKESLDANDDNTEILETNNIDNVMQGNTQGDLDDNTSILTSGRYTAEDKAIVAKATEGYSLEEINFEKLAQTLNRDIKAVKQRVRKQYK